MSPRICTVTPLGSAAGRRSTATTGTPRAASRSTRARPMNPPAPVTTTGPPPLSVPAGAIAGDNNRSAGNLISRPRGLSRGGAHAKQRAAPPGRTAAERKVSSRVPRSLSISKRCAGASLRARRRSAVIGLGYVGLPLVGAIAGAGFHVVGFDVDAAKVALLNAGRSYIRHIPDAAIAELVREPPLPRRRRFRRARRGRRRADLRADAADPPPRARSLLSSSAPPRRSRRICAAASSSCWNRRHIPAPRASVMRPILERGGLRSGDDFFLAYSPEREDPGNAQYSTTKIPKVVGGDGDCGAGARGRALRPIRRRHRPGLLGRDRGGGEAHREHLPRRQHRPRQRAEDGLRGAWASTSGR